MRARPSGFTLVEVVITLAIIAIAGMLAVPEFTSLMANRRVVGVADDLFGTLLYARSEAIRQNQSIQVLPIGGNWSNGWQMANPAQAGTFLLQHAASKVVVTEAGNAPDVTFLPSGRLPAAANGPVFSVCDLKNIANQRLVSLDLSGQPSIKVVQGGCQ